MLPEPFRVVRTRREARETITLELAPEGRARELRFEPGQFNMVYAFGVGEVPISISGDPRETETVFHTIREVGAVSRAICAAKRGDVLGIRGPFGSAWPIDAAAGGDVVVIGGGIGLAPLRPILYHLQSNRDRFERVSVLYGCRTPDDLLFARHVKQLRGRFDLDVQVTVDTAGPEWRAPVGPVTMLIPKATFDPSITTAFVCGPEIMIRFVVRELESLGVAADRIFLSMERNMKCAVGFCGHCQLGPRFICKDGPVFSHAELAPLMRVVEL